MRAHIGMMFSILCTIVNGRIRILDYYRPGDWLDRDNAVSVLAWEGEALVGFVATALPLNGASWDTVAGGPVKIAPSCLFCKLSGKPYCRNLSNALQIV